MTTFSVATEVTALAGGRQPAWATAKLSALLGAAPSGLAEGWLVENAVVGHLHIACREQPGNRTMYITMPVFDEATTYTATMNGGGAEVVATGLTAAEALEQMRATINLFPGATATLYSGTDPFGRVHVDAIRVTGMRSLDFTVAGGTGTMLGICDAEGAWVQLYALMEARSSTTAPVSWTKFGPPLFVGPQGITKRLILGGAARVTAQVLASGNALDSKTAVTSSALAVIGPALSES